jgi:hypothetical protein
MKSNDFKDKETFWILETAAMKKLMCNFFLEIPKKKFSLVLK